MKIYTNSPYVKTQNNCHLLSGYRAKHFIDIIQFNTLCGMPLFQIRKHWHRKGKVGDHSHTARRGPEA